MTVSVKNSHVVKNSYSYDELINCGEGGLFGEGNAQLPLPQMLMIDRITHISHNEGNAGLGLVLAELDIHPDLWFFKCHFKNDPVMPGCLGLDAMWQLVGFYLGWRGFPGQGRALGCGEVKFSGQVLPKNKLVQYEIQIRKVISRSLILGVADGLVRVDGEIIYRANDLRVGLFKATSVDSQ